MFSCTNEVKKKTKIKYQIKKESNVTIFIAIIGDDENGKLTCHGHKCPNASGRLHLVFPTGHAHHFQCNQYIATKNGYCYHLKPYRNYFTTHTEYRLVNKRNGAAFDLT